jgi:AsmA-like protein
MPSMLDLSFSANHISVAEAAKLVAASGVALSESTLMTGNVNATIRATGTAEKPALNGKVVASNLQMSGNGIPQSIQIPSIDLALKPTLIQSNQFTLSSGGTSVNAQIAISDYLSSAPNVDAIVRSANAQLPAILSMAKAYGVRNLDKVNGEGTMKLDMHATGPLKSITVAEITRALNGTVDMNLNDITYSGANVTRELSAIAGFLNPSAVPESTNDVTKILKMTGSILVKNGIAQTNNLAAKLDIGNVGAVGMANLVDQTLNVRLTAVLTQQVSQKAGGGNVGGLMQTALANNRGELVIPALVTGTFAQPKFSPDLQQITQMKMQQLLPNFENPASVTGALQNFLGGAKNHSQLPQSPGQQQTTPSERNPVQEIIDIFGQKKKKSDQQPPK